MTWRKSGTTFCITSSGLGTSRLARGSSFGRQGLPRSHLPADHVRDVLRARHVCGDPVCCVSLRFETHVEHCVGLWRRFVAHSSRPRGFCVASFHPTFRFGWPRHHRIPDDLRDTCSHGRVCRSGSCDHDDSTCDSCYPAKGHVSDCILIEVAHDAVCAAHVRGSSFQLCGDTINHHVRDDQRDRHVLGDPGRIVSALRDARQAP